MVLQPNTQDDMCSASDLRSSLDASHGEGDVVNTQPTKISGISDFNKFYFVTDPSSQMPQCIVLKNNNQIVYSNEKDRSHDVIEIDSYNDHSGDDGSTDLSDQVMHTAVLDNTVSVIDERKLKVPLSTISCETNADMPINMLSVVSEKNHIPVTTQSLMSERNMMPVGVMSVTNKNNSMPCHTVLNKRGIVMSANNLSDVTGTDLAVLDGMTKEIEANQVRLEWVDDILHAAQLQDHNKDIYNFEQSPENKDCSFKNSINSAAKDNVDVNSSSCILKANIHKSSCQGEVIFVPVGTAVKEFLKSHSLIRGIYLNKGKRDLKRELVTVKRQNNAVDTGSWKRGKHIHERNRFDDLFEYTDAGRRKKSQLDKKKIRDVYVVNWYVWCPGHGNCRRTCGGHGTCIAGQ